MLLVLLVLTLTLILTITITIIILTTVTTITILTGTTHIPVTIMTMLVFCPWRRLARDPLSALTSRSDQYMPAIFAYCVLARIRGTFKGGYRGYIEFK